MSEQVPSIGIDFGTTNSSMAWYDPRIESAEIILNAEGQTRTPSLVYFGENETLVGKPVESLIKDASTDRVRREEVFRRVIKSIKRNLLSPPRIALPGGRYVRPVDVVAEILKKLKRDAEDGYFHEEVGRAVITYPAAFNVLQRQRIEEAGRLAGFGEVVLLEEPVAGTLAYARAELNVGKHVLVYDLGGGMFDLAVLDNEDESFHVAMEPKGMERCGGDDFDHALYYHCDELAREKLGRSISLTSAVDLSFLRECRRRKESLSFQERIEFNDYLPSDDGPVLFEHEVERQTFEDLIGEYVETSARLTEEILKQAAVRGHEVDTVVLVGGSTRVPLVMRTLEETLPLSPLGFDRNDIAVALGAAHYTNIRSPTMRRGKQPETSVLTPEDQSPLNQYRGAVEEAFSDKELSKVEVDRLNAFAGQLGLDREQTADIERQVMGDAKEGVLLQPEQDERLLSSQTAARPARRSLTALFREKWRPGKPRGVTIALGLVVIMALVGTLAGIEIITNGSSLTKGSNPAPGYDLMKHQSGKLSVEVPTTWKEHVTTNPEGEKGKGWDSFAGESVIAMTAANDLHSWSTGSKGHQGMYIAVSKKLAQSYTDDELVASGPHDYSSSCQAGPRRDFDRPPYSGKIQEWNDCGGIAGHTATTLAAAPKDRECVVLLLIGGYLQGEEENIRHILDTFEADCRGIG